MCVSGVWATSRASTSASKPGVPNLSSASLHAGEAAARQHAAAPPPRARSARSIRLDIPRDPSAVRSPPRSSKCERRLPIVPVYAARAPSAASASRAATSPGCCSVSPGWSKRPSGAYRRAPSRKVMTDSSITRHATCAGGMTTPLRARRIAGSHTRAHGRRPCRACSSPSKAGTPGTAHDAGPRPRHARLRAERHLEMHEVVAASLECSAQKPSMFSATCSRLVPVDRVSAAEQPGHDRLGDTRRERCRNRCIRGAAAVAQDLDARLCGGRVARCNAGDHALRGIAVQPMRATFSRGKSLRHDISAASALKG